MKGITLGSIVFGDNVRMRKGTMVSFDPNSLKHSYVDVAFNGKTYRVHCEDLAATEAETVQDVDYCVTLQKEMEKHDRLLIELCLEKDGTEYGYYIFSGEASDEQILPQRKMLYRMVRKLADDSSIDCYLLSERENGGYNFLHLTNGMFAKIHEFWNRNDGILYFRNM